MYSGEAAGWKCYLEHLLKPYGGVFLFHCDFDPKDYNFSNNFYAELIRFWADFRNAFSEQDSRGSIIWNNKNVRIDGQPVFYKRFLEKNVISIRQLGLSQSNLESLDTISNVTSLKCNFLQWASLRSAIPDFLRYKEDDVSNLEQLGFYHNNTFFVASEARSKHYYNLLIQLKATLPNGAKR